MTDQPENTSAGTKSQCGYVAIVGRPNVGKSTLLNHILGQKISITSRKPQTTQHQIIGIWTEGPVQAIYVDTPGMHDDDSRAINRHMNRAATAALSHVDVVVFVVDKLQWTTDDERVLEKLKRVSCPVVLAINKVDQIADRDKLLPHIQHLSSLYNFSDIVPLSALKGNNLDRLTQVIGGYLPEDVHFYDEDQITDRSQRFLAAELVREKVMRQLGAELPYSVAVEIESFQDSGKSLHINALILVERQGQKKIVIGEGGERLRQIGQEARVDMERLFDRKVMLRLWVKVRKGWSDDERALRSLGFHDS